MAVELLEELSRTVGGFTVEALAAEHASILNAEHHLPRERKKRYFPLLIRRAQSLVVVEPDDEQDRRGEKKQDGDEL